MAQIKTKFITDNAITNAKAAQMAAHTYKGNNTGSTANSLDVTSTQLTADLNQFTTSLQGLVPGSGGGTANFLRADGTWATPPNSGGTVTSVALSDGSSSPIYTISGSPVTTSGTLTITLSTQSANTVHAGPTAGGAVQPTFRLLVPADIPTLNQNTTGTASNVTGIVAIANGGTGQSSASSAFGALSPLTTKGDILGYSTLNARVPVGTNGQILTADSTQALGIKWASPAVTSTTIEESITLSGTDITNQYVDLAHPASGASASVNSVSLFVIGAPIQQKTVDYTVSLTGGSGGVTRLTFAGDLATGGPAALIAGDILVIQYTY